MDLRRAVLILPATAIYTLIFLLVSLLIIKNGEKLFFNPNQTVQVPVGLYMPGDDDSTKAGLSLVENMQSFRDTLQINHFDSEDDGIKALSENKIMALIVIPEGFVDAIYKNENLPIRIVFNENNTMEEHIVNDLLLSSAQLLGIEQATEFSFELILQKYPADPDTSQTVLKGLSSSNLAYVLTRYEMFREESFDRLTALPLTKQLAACYTILVIALLSFVLTPFYQGRKDAYVIRQHAAGLGRAGIHLSELISTLMLLYFAYLIIFTALSIAGFGPKLISLIGIFPMLTVLALFIHGVAYLVKNSAYANLIILVGIILLMYLSGGLIPMELLPRFLQELSHYNPVYGLIRLTQGIMY